MSSSRGKSFKRSPVAARRVSGRTELAAGYGTLISRLVPPGEWWVVAVDRGHTEISGSVTGLMSRPFAGMCPLSQVGSVRVSRTAANIRFCLIWRRS
jgi:hypothetical protein